jgi:hypothetical protein
MAASAICNARCGVASSIPVTKLRIFARPFQRCLPSARVTLARHLPNPRSNAWMVYCLYCIDVRSGRQGGLTASPLVPLPALSLTRAKRGPKSGKPVGPRVPGGSCCRFPHRSGQHHLSLLFVCDHFERDLCNIVFIGTFCLAFVCCLFFVWCLF